jgi:cell division protein FtsQ
VDPTVDPRHFSTLPHLIGAGANTEAVKLLPVLSQRPRLMARVRAIRRVDERRWDLLLKDGGTILLPDSEEGAALDRLDRLDQTSHILDLGLARLDLRNPRFVVARPGTVSASPAANRAANGTASAPSSAAAKASAQAADSSPPATESRD